METERVYITTNDPMLNIIMDEEECKNFFGDDFLDEDNQSILPLELVKRFKKNWDEMIEIQKEIKNYIG